MGMGSWRIALAVFLLIAFMGSYSWVLINNMGMRADDCNELQRLLIESYSIKVLAFSTYTVTNSLMMGSYQSQFERELLLTGIFSIIFISVATLLHYTHLLIMPTQWNLILFNGTTIAFFLIIYMEGRKHELFKD